jgi:CAAX protease family protein
MSIPRRIVAFFLLAYALTWFGHVGNALLPSPAWPLPMFPFGPLIAAPVVIGWTEGRAGLAAWLRRIARVRAPARVYAAAFLVPLAIVLASVGLAVALGTPAGPLPGYGLAQLLAFVPLVALDGPAPEEASFRGYGQHELQTVVSPLAAGLWIGLGVLVWHAPVLIGGYIPWTIAVALPAVSVVYAWLYRAGGSVWPLVVLHFVINYFGAGLFGAVFAPEDAEIWTGLLAGFFVLWALLLAWHLGPSLRRPAVAA